MTESTILYFITGVNACWNFKDFPKTNKEKLLLRQWYKSDWKLKQYRQYSSISAIMN